VPQTSTLFESVRNGGCADCTRAGPLGELLQPPNPARMMATDAAATLAERNDGTCQECVMEPSRTLGAGWYAIALCNASRFVGILRIAAIGSADWKRSRLCRHARLAMMPIWRHRRSPRPRDRSGPTARRSSSSPLAWSGWDPTRPRRHLRFRRNRRRRARPMGSSRRPHRRRSRCPEGALARLHWQYCPLHAGGVSHPVDGTRATVHVSTSPTVTLQRNISEWAMQYAWLGGFCTVDIAHVTTVP
jgi:hypothetical protein